jgi:hypothetical protein
MNLFKRAKGKPKMQSINTIQIGLEYFPTKALDLTYNELMDQYKEERTEKLQKILVAISKELRVRANTNGNVETVQVAFENGNSQQTIEDLNKAQEKANKIIVEENKKIAEEKIVKEHKKEKQRVSFTSFFKKKVKVKPPKPVPLTLPPRDQVEQTIEKIQEQQPEIFQKEEKPKASITSMLKSKPLFKKKSKTGFDIKSLGDIYCPDCKHHVNTHQSHGKSQGCKKCGCLRTITFIANASDIKVQKFESQEVAEAVTKSADQLQSMQLDICTCRHTLKQHSRRDYHCRVKVCECVEYNAR